MSKLGPIVVHSPPSVPPVAKELPSARCFSGGGPTPYGYDIVAPIMVVKHEKGVATKTFPGASRSEPHMEYVEEPTMIYMAFLMSIPFCFSFWFLTRFV